MSIFSKAVSAVKNTATKAVSAVKNAVSKVSNKTQGASAMNFKVGQGLTPSQTKAAVATVTPSKKISSNGLTYSAKDYKTIESTKPSSSQPKITIKELQDLVSSGGLSVSSDPSGILTSSSTKNLTSENIPTTFNATDFSGDVGTFDAPAIMSPDIGSSIGTRLGMSSLNSGSNSGMTGSTLGSEMATDFQSEEQKRIQEERQQERQNLMDLMSEVAGLPKEQAKLEKKAGLPEANAELRDLQAKQTLQTAQYMSQLQDIQNKPIAMEFIAGQQGEVQRRAGIDAMITSALVQAKQGQIQTAQDSIDQAIKMKYDGLITRIDAQKQILEWNYQDLSREDKKQADIRNEQLKIKEKQLDQLMNFQNFAVKNAVAQGAPSSVVSNMMNAGSIGEIVQVGGDFIKEPNTDIVKLENGNTIVVDRATGKVIKNLGGGIVENNLSVITDEMMQKTYGSDVTSMVSNVIKSNKAKGTATMVNAINVLAGVQQFAESNPDGQFEGLNPLLRTPSKFASQQSVSNRSTIEAINLKVQQWASGASLTEEQTKKVNKLTPNIGDTDKQVRDKTNALANYMISQISGELVGQGINFKAPKVDLFNTQNLDKDPLKLGTLPGSQGDSLGLFD